MERYILANLKRLFEKEKQTTFIYCPNCNNELIKASKFNNKCDDEDIKHYEREIQAIENLIQENKELKDKNYNIAYNAGKAFKNHEWVTKVKAKMEELDIEIQECEYADDDVEEYKIDVEKEKSRLLRDKRVLQELLEEGE